MASKKLTGLVPTGKKRSRPVQHQVDERVLRLLGIETFEVEMDYDSYKIALREVMISGRMGGKAKFPQEEDALLLNEWRRVKGRKGRFIPKAKKVVIKAPNIKKGSATGSKVAKKTRVSLPPAKRDASEDNTRISGVKEKRLESSSSGVLNDITGSLGNIIKLLKKENKFDRKSAEKDRKSGESKNRTKLLGSLKKGAGKIAKVAKKVLKPVKGILENIINFFVKLFLGRLVIKLFEWFADPKNKKKVDSLFRFFGDIWKTLVAGFEFLGEAFTWLSKEIVPILKGLGMGLLGLLTGNPILAMAMAGTGYFSAKYAQKFDTKQKEDGDQEKSSSTKSSSLEGFDDEPEPPPTQNASGGGSIRGFDGGGFAQGFAKGFSGGGFNWKNVLGGFVSGQKGVDKVPAMLTDGEFVMSKGAVDMWGLNTLERMNADGGGDNKPKIMRGSTFAQGGGQVGKEIGRAHV